ncbi:hypothetical protein SNE25_04440 [Mucilaginibacter sabulilitoris]|uniref:Zinc-finger domain-containing protein n=1 Tax=Mucilaginibacter sabulilitoris TaxID=1173583 RepID=A0ABZ0TNX1_9SPHI|nr:hypothetical protein [Mucilaginibacter sabulilitoris]WPU94768.1 hypothetical protein SNE25_04440 [Mucilaginibacter sabulilitoris]
MKKILKTEEDRIAYNCRKATYLIEKKQDEELIVREQMELQLHLAGCYICRVYEQQSIMINGMIKKLLSEPHEVELGQEFKENMKKKIEEKIANKH